ncbi:MAG: nucleotidyltransferase domain-containing protein [archaeon]
MLLSKLFSSEERLKALQIILSNETNGIKVRETARKVHASPSLVFTTVELLKKEGVIKKGKIDLFNPKTKTIKLTLNMQKLQDNKLIEFIRKEIKDCKGIGLYGSWAQGINTVDSDIDLWIKSENEDYLKETKIKKHIEKKLGQEANLLFLSEKKLKQLKEKNFVFYCMLFNSFVLWGEGV